MRVELDMLIFQKYDGVRILESVGVQQYSHRFVFQGRL